MSSGTARRRRPPSLAPALLGAALAVALAATEADAERPPLAAALARAAAGDLPIGSLRLAGECFVGGEFPRFEVHGDGFGVWNDSLQMKVSDATLRDLVAALDEAGFAGLDEVVGDPDAGRPRRPSADRPPDGRAALELLCRIEVALGDARHRVTQLSEGERSEALFALARRLVELLREPAATGIGISGLDDGLAKLAAGTLDPRTLTIRLLRKPELGAAGEDGYELELDGTRASRRRVAASGERSSPARAELEPETVRSLAAELAELGLATLPRNLWADDYVDVHVQVLDRRSSLQARRFAGMTPTTHGERQRDFERMLGRLAAIAARVRGRAAEASVDAR